MTDNPFKTGASVLLLGRYMKGTVPRKIDRVYVNGNFTLEGDRSRQQYKPQKSWSGANWTAEETGSRWHAGTVYPDNEVTRAHFEKINQAEALARRASIVLNEITKWRGAEISERIVDSLEIVLEKHNAEVAERNKAKG